MIFDAAVRSIRSISGPLKLEFPLPERSDPNSLRPGSLATYLSASKTPALKKPPGLDAAAVAGARPAASQFSSRGSQYRDGSRQAFTAAI
ncbi:hypothetical protein AMTR_s00024p00147640 [Amborella trichopoda]|uniref:Uncharacterized protein n=1 Tax=Amborella trichopoda TaxID=13333 RepID=W1PM42_AMBTC|nr:hypothetical protein AMTR_s00024p00147640 [Amborella trichopoda]